MFQVFAPFPKIQDVFIKTFPYGGRSAFITFSHVVEADKAYELAFQSAKQKNPEKSIGIDHSAQKKIIKVSRNHKVVALEVRAD